MLTILPGDCRQTLATLPAESVQTCVTSPPYYGLRDYGCAGQIGLEQTPEAFVAEMVAVFREVRRVLREDGTLFLNLGDSYFGGGRGGNPASSPHQKQRTNRGSVSMPASARRVNACDTSGKAPANSPASDCLCGNLCDACRRAYQIGKSHNDSALVPTPAPSPCDPTRARTESAPGRPPTSDSFPLADRNGDATPLAGRTPVPAGEPLPVVQASTNGESCLPPLADFRQSDPPSGCRLCECSLLGSVPASARKAECKCGTSARGSVPDILRTDVSGSAYPYSTTKSLRNKDLIGIPWRVAFALQADGWILRSDIIWHKPNPMPESITDRPTKSHEYLFLLTKSPRYFYDAAAIQEPVSGSANARVSKAAAARISDRREAGMLPTASNAENAGVNPKARVEQFNVASTSTLKVALSLPVENRNKRTVWTVASAPYSEAHFACFPPALVRPCVLAGSRPADIILDPFGGSGTTGMVAIEHGRRAVLCELNPAYCDLIRQRCDVTPGLNFTTPPTPNHAGPGPGNAEVVR